MSDADRQTQHAVHREQLGRQFCAWCGVRLNPEEESPYCSDGCSASAYRAHRAVTADDERAR